MIEEIADSAVSPNGTGSIGAGSYTAAEIEKLKQRGLLFGTAFAKIVSLMMHSSVHNHLHISDLSWPLVPPLLAEQIAMVEAVPQGGVVPQAYAAAVWARVSPEVDRRLSEDKSLPVRLSADEWQSGNIPWIIDAVGHPDIVPPFLEEFVATHFPGQYFKMRAVDKQGAVKTVFVGLDHLELAL